MKRRENVHAIGIHERLGIHYGDMYVTGVLRVRSAYPKFDKYMGDEKVSNWSLNLKIRLSDRRKNNILTMLHRKQKFLNGS